MNNIYTNVVRYSPLYLSWSAYLETFLQKGKNWKFWLIDRLANLDWDYLVMIGAATSDEAEKIILLTEIDGGSALTKMRVTTEKMIQVAYKREYPTRRHPNLANMLQQLNNKHIFPSIIYVCLDTIRKAGNIGAHEIMAESDDAIAILPLFIRVVEWFIDYERRIYIL